MNSVSIIINGVRYDATDMNQWTDCDKCDLHGICMVSHWWIKEACTEIGDHKGTVIFKINKEEN